MKRVSIQDFDASDVLTERIDLPGEKELAAANILNSVTGGPAIDSWFKFGKSKSYSDSTLTTVGDLAKRREVRASTRATVGAEPYRHELVEVQPGITMLDTKGHVYNFERNFEGDWTVAAVLSLDESFSSGTNGSVMGGRPGGTFVNAPMINLTGTLVIRTFGDPGHATTGLFVSDAIPNIRSKPYLIVVSQSELNGFTCRVNGVEKQRTSTANSRRRSTGRLLRVLGSDLSSAAVNGMIGDTFLINEDISRDPLKCSAIEGYLMDAFNVIPD